MAGLIKRPLKRIRFYVKLLITPQTIFRLCCVHPPAGEGELNPCCWQGGDAWILPQPKLRPTHFLQDFTFEVLKISRFQTLVTRHQFLNPAA